MTKYRPVGPAKIIRFSSVQCYLHQAEVPVELIPNLIAIIS